MRTTVLTAVIFLVGTLLPLGTVVLAQDAGALPGGRLSVPSGPAQPATQSPNFAPPAGALGLRPVGIIVFQVFGTGARTQEYVRLGKAENGVVPVLLPNNVTVKVGAESIKVVLPYDRIYTPNLSTEKKVDEAVKVIDMLRGLAANPQTQPEDARRLNSLADRLVTEVAKVRQTALPPATIGPVPPAPGQRQTAETPSTGSGTASNTRSAPRPTVSSGTSPTVNTSPPTRPQRKPMKDVSVLRQMKETPSDALVLANGRSFKEPKILRISPAGVSLMHSAGSATMPLDAFPDDLSALSKEDQGKIRLARERLAKSGQREAAQRKGTSGQLAMTQDAVAVIAMAYGVVPEQLAQLAEQLRERKPAWKATQINRELHDAITIAGIRLAQKAVEDAGGRIPDSKMSAMSYSLVRSGLVLPEVQRLLGERHGGQFFVASTQGTIVDVPTRPLNLQPPERGPEVVATEPAAEEGPANAEEPAEEEKVQIIDNTPRRGQVIMQSDW